MFACVLKSIFNYLDDTALDIENSLIVASK